MVCDGTGMEYTCQIEEFPAGEVKLSVLTAEKAATELPVRLKLYQGLPKKDKMELIIQKAVELGVYEIIPTVTSRCIVKIDAKKEDIVIVDSPVGMPGRAIHNAFLDKVKAGERFMRGCRQCIKSCNPAKAPYCITEALINAVEGRLDEGLIFCGENAYRAKKIERVEDIMKEFIL